MSCFYKLDPLSSEIKTVQYFEKNLLILDFPFLN